METPRPLPRHSRNTLPCCPFPQLATLLSRMLKDTLNIARIIALPAWLILSACSVSDPELQELAGRIYAQKTWEEPLPPHRFESDGCSWWPDREWVECCVIHDSVYWMGGTSEERIQADGEMRNCVSSTGHPVISSIMYYGVRAGGVYWLPTSFRWGFGWDYPQAGPPGKRY